MLRLRQAHGFYLLSAEARAKMLYMDARYVPTSAPALCERRSQFYCLLVFELPTSALSRAVTEVISVELELDMGHVKDRLHVVHSSAGWRRSCSIERNGEHKDAVLLRHHCGSASEFAFR